ncbi:RRM domain-containing protein [Mycena indigotica]|uniref:RRM domain-containing protein n=1 Tax=Mycena indigotica TaxID=2126181 RepID=A0A8H6VYA5_9AGAR|nr:RRM domain-containing protein [Mycena indigotica]KAF7298589.1 RRM domain-containing protein [Mycena indigotica]
MSKVVFVGNIPYKTSEDSLARVLNRAGQVLALRLVSDRDTGRLKGYGFCEFADHATALSAVRNLNNIEVNGRSLRISLAELDPILQGKTTKRGGIVEESDDGSSDVGDGREILSAIPLGRPLAPGRRAEEVIKQFMHDCSSMELQEILAQMKVLALEFEVSRIHLTWTSYDQAFAFTHPKRALALLQQQPQVGFAVYVGFAASGIISSSSLQQLLDTAKAPVAYSPTSAAFCIEYSTH